MQSPPVSIIVLNWNGKSDTLECLDSLRRDLYPNKKILVVDNGSTDDSVARIKESFPEIEIIETGENLGFTGGNNVGIEHCLSSCDYVYLLNNDTVSEPEALSELVEAAQSAPEFGVLTPLIFYYDRPDEPWFCGSSLRLDKGIAVHDNSQIPQISDGTTELLWASGCALLVRADLMKQLKGFDSRYFLNWEDVDLSLRARALGSRIGIVPSARIQHKVSRSFQGISHVGLYYYVRNNLLLVRTHNAKHFRKAACHILFSRLRDNFRDLRKRRPNALLSTRAIFHAANDDRKRRYGSI